MVDNKNFMIYAAQHYDNINCVSDSEFEEDLNRIRYIGKLFKRYKESGNLKERLILNHLIVLYNVFDPQACTKMLCLKLTDYLDYLKPFLLFLNYWPERIDNVDNVTIISSYIKMDDEIINRLRELNGTIN